MTDMKERIQQIQHDIAQAAKRSGRSATDVLLLGVSKTFNMEAIQQAAQGGVQAFGESYVQEFIDKYDENKGFEFHFIGQLQSNKVKYIVNKVAMVHSVDRLSLAKELSKRALANGRCMDVLVQVNIGMEEQKGGIAPDDLDEFLNQMGNFEGIRLCGLMCIHPFVPPEEARLYFKRMKAIFESMREKGYHMQHLSMGMSADYVQAVEEGATIVRVGSALFGSRY